MHEFNLKMIKIIMVIAVLAVIVGMLGGISALKNNYYWKAKYFAMQIDYAKEKIAYAKYVRGSRFAWYSSFLKDKAPAETDGEYAKSVPVLLYHGIIDRPDWKSDGVNVSLADFREQMFALKKAGYEAISLSQFLKFIQEKEPLPKKSVLITFDDARADSYYPADPILRVLNYRAVMFVITGRSFGPDNEKNTFHLSENELKKMVASNRWEMGSHTQNGHGSEKIDGNGTLGHFLSNRLWIDSQSRLETEAEYAGRIKADLLASRKDLEKNLGIKVLALAYPFGDYGNNSQNFSESAGILRETTNSFFPLSFRQGGESEFPRNYPGENYRLIRRINVGSEMPANQLLFILNSGSEKNLPYNDAFAQNEGWLTGWGGSELKNGLLITRASALENSSLAFLNGTFSWANYTLNAAVRLIQGNAFAVIARYANGNNYVSCDFSRGGISLSQRIGGAENVIFESNLIFQIPADRDAEVGMAVSGNKAICYLEGKEVAAGNISPKLSRGGIGFKTWDNSLDNSYLLVSRLKADPAP